MAVELTWISHASFRLAAGSVVYVDPWKIDARPRDGNVVFVSHAHHDHCSGADVRKVLAGGGVIYAPPDAAEDLGGKPLRPRDAVEAGDVRITAVPAYNIGKDYHPKDRHWLGAVFETGGARIYYAGDTDRIPEMAQLAAIDLALLPVGGTYTMTAAEAADAAADIGCRAAVPYHFGDIVGTRADAAAFADAAGCTVHVLAAGESLTVGA